MKPQTKLKIVANTHRPVLLPEGLHDYEHKQRQRLKQTDWSMLHIRGDRNPPLEIPDRPKRWWRA